MDKSASSSAARSSQPPQPTGKAAAKRRCITETNRVAVKGLMSLRNESLLPGRQKFGRGVNAKSMATYVESRAQFVKQYLTEICHSKTLQHADLHDCAMSADDFVMLKSILKDHPSITTVDLSKNSLDAIAVGLICDVLKVNKRIVDVNVEDTGLSMGMMYKIDAALQQNIDLLSEKSERRERRSKIRITQEMAEAFARAVNDIIEEESVGRAGATAEERDERRAIVAKAKKHHQEILRDEACGRLLRQQEGERESSRREEHGYRVQLVSMEEQEMRALLECGVVLVHSQVAQDQTQEFDRIRRFERGEWVLASRRQRDRLQSNAASRRALEDAETRARRQIVVQERFNVPSLRDAMSAVAQEAAQSPQEASGDSRQHKKAKEDALKQRQALERRHLEHEATSAKSAFTMDVISICQTVEDAIHAVNACAYELSHVYTARNRLDVLLREDAQLTLVNAGGAPRKSADELPICFGMTCKPVRLCPEAAVRLAMRPAWQEEVEDCIRAADAISANFDTCLHDSVQILGGAISDLMELGRPPASPRRRTSMSTDWCPVMFHECSAAAASSYKALLKEIEPQLSGVRGTAVDVGAVLKTKARMLSGSITLTVAHSSSQHGTDHLVPDPEYEPDAGAPMRLRTHGSHTHVRVPPRTQAEAFCTTMASEQLQQALDRRRRAFAEEDEDDDDRGYAAGDVDPLAFEAFLVPAPSAHCDFFLGGDAEVLMVAMTDYLRHVRYYSSEGEAALRVPQIRHIGLRVAVELMSAPAATNGGNMALDAAGLEAVLTPRYATLEESLHVLISSPYLWVDRGFLISKFIEGTAPEAHPLLPRFHLGGAPVLVPRTNTTTTRSGADSPRTAKGGPSCCTCGTDAVLYEVASAPCHFSFAKCTLKIAFAYGNDVEDRIMLASSGYCWIQTATGGANPPPIVMVNPSGFDELAIGFISKGELLSCAEATRQPAREKPQAAIEITIESPQCRGEHLRRLLSSLRYFSSTIGPRMGVRQVDLTVTDSAGRASVTSVLVDVVAIKSVQISRRCLAECAACGRATCEVHLGSEARQKWMSQHLPFHDAEVLAAEETVATATLAVVARCPALSTEEGVRVLREVALSFDMEYLASESGGAARILSPPAEELSTRAEWTGAVPIAVLTSALRQVRVRFAQSNATCDAVVEITATLRSVLRDGTVTEALTSSTLTILRATSSSAVTVQPSLFVRGAPQRLLAGYVRFPDADSRCQEAHQMSLRFDIVEGGARGDEITMLVPPHSRSHAQPPLALVASRSRKLVYWHGAQVGVALIEPHPSDGTSGLHLLCDSFDTFCAGQLANGFLEYVSCNFSAPGKRVIRATMAMGRAQEPSQSVQYDLFWPVDAVDANLTSITAISLTREVCGFMAGGARVRAGSRGTPTPVPLLPFGSVCVRSAEYFDGGRLTVELGDASSSTGPLSLVLLSPTLQVFHANSLGLDDPTSVLQLFNLVHDQETNELSCDINGGIQTIGRFARRTRTAWTLEFDIHTPPVATPVVVEYIVSCVGVTVDGDATLAGSYPAGCSCVLRLTEPTSRIGAALVVDVVIDPPLVVAATEGDLSYPASLPGTSPVDAKGPPAPLRRWIWQLAPGRSRITTPFKLLLCPADDVELGLRSSTYAKTSDGAIVANGTAAESAPMRVAGIEFGLLGLTIEVGEESTRASLSRYEEILRALVIAPQVEQADAPSVRSPVLSLLITSADGSYEVEFFAPMKE